MFFKECFKRKRGAYPSCVHEPNIVVAKCKEKQLKQCEFLRPSPMYNVIYLVKMHIKNTIYENHEYYFGCCVLSREFLGQENEKEYVITLLEDNRWS